MVINTHDSPRLLSPLIPFLSSAVMEDGVSSFPLLQLHNNALKCVLQNMSMHEQIGFSIISKTSKALIKLLNLTTRYIIVNVVGPISMSVAYPEENDGDIEFYFYTEKFCEDEDEGIHPSPNKMYTPDFLFSRMDEDEEEEKEYEWKKTGFEMKDWIDHFLSIFNHPTVKYLDFQNRIEFDLESFPNTFNKLTEIHISELYTDDYIKKVVQAFLFVKKLVLDFRNGHGLDDLHDVLCQNFDFLLLLGGCPGSETKWKLDDLLVMNSRTIDFCYSNFTEKDFNAFFKHWINGSNKRLEHLGISFIGMWNPNKEIILHGLDHQVAPINQERLFKKSARNLDETSTVIVKGGYDIRRMDGTTATILIHEDHLQEYYNLELFVWN